MRQMIFAAVLFVAALAYGCGQNNLAGTSSALSDPVHCPTGCGSCDQDNCEVSSDKTLDPEDEGSPGCGRCDKDDRPCACERERRCLEKGKAFVCHVPPGNPANEHNICVGQPSVKAHLKHGDRLGPCQGTCPPPGDAGTPVSDAGAPPACRAEYEKCSTLYPCCSGLSCAYGTCAKPVH